MALEQYMKVVNKRNKYAELASVRAAGIMLDRGIAK